MIDWVTVVIPVDGSGLRAGRVAHLTPDGVIEWSRPKPVQVEEPSYSVRVAAWHERGNLYISGNPAKWLTGHNWLGTWDVQPLLTEFVLDILVYLEHDFSRIYGPERWRLTRIDLTHSYDFGSQDEVRKALQALQLTANLPHRGRGRFADKHGEQTLYYGQHSRRWSLKLYDKYTEQRAHNPVLLADLLKSGVAREGILRVELTLRQMELRKIGLENVTSWGPGVAETVYNGYVSKLSVSASEVSVPVWELPPRLHGLYEMWKRGVVLQNKLSRASWYRARKELLAYGVDIASLPGPVLEVEERRYSLPPVSEWRAVPHYPHSDVPRVTRYIQV